MNENLPLPNPEELPQTQVEATALNGLKRFFRFRHGQSKIALPLDTLSDTQVADYDSEAEPASDSYQFLTEQLSDDALATRMRELEAEMETSPELSKLHAIKTTMAKNVADDKQAYESNDKETAARLQKEYLGLSHEASLFPYEARRSYATWEDKLYQLEKPVYKSVIVGPQENIAQTLLAYLKDAKPVQGATNEEAPFAHHQENSDESWQAVDDQDVREYLNDRKFINIGYGEVESGSVEVKGEKDKPFEVSLSLLVGAAGFDSWVGRNPKDGKGWSSKYGAGNMKSLDVIKHYAGLSSEVPAVGQIRVLIQPNGTVLCDNGSGDSHRIAAAILQGQEFIKADNLSFVRLKENLI